MFYHLFIANIAKDFVHVNEYFIDYSQMVSVIILSEKLFRGLQAVPVNNAQYFALYGRCGTDAIAIVNWLPKAATTLGTLQIANRLHFVRRKP